MISFNTIKNLFDPNLWDVGYLSADDLLCCAYSPVKFQFHYIGENWTNSLEYRNPSNCIVLVRAGHTWDYSLYEEAINILHKANLTSPWSMAYTNFKLAAILSGLGVRARNSLIYSYKFGFDCHIAVVRFQDIIVDIPTNKRINNELWNRCKGCDDCVKACPANAIHADKEPYWLDSAKCSNYCVFGKTDVIPSLYDYWKENVYPELPHEEAQKLIGPANYLPWDRNGYSYDGQVVKKDNVSIQIPFCRECTAQPRCSKWGGNYPYDKVVQQDYSVINFYSRPDNVEDNT